MRCEVGDWVMFKGYREIYIAEVIRRYERDGRVCLMTDDGEVLEDSVLERRPGGGA